MILLYSVSLGILIMATVYVLSEIVLDVIERSERRKVIQKQLDYCMNIDSYNIQSTKKEVTTNNVNAQRDDTTVENVAVVSVLVHTALDDNNATDYSCASDYSSSSSDSGGSYD